MCLSRLEEESGRSGDEEGGGGGDDDVRGERGDGGSASRWDRGGLPRSRSGREGDEGARWRATGSSGGGGGTPGGVLAAAIEPPIQIRSGGSTLPRAAAHVQPPPSSRRPQALATYAQERSAVSRCERPQLDGSHPATPEPRRRQISAIFARQRPWGGARGGGAWTLTGAPPKTQIPPPRPSEAGLTRTHRRPTAGGD